MSFVFKNIPRGKGRACPKSEVSAPFSTLQTDTRETKTETEENSREAELRKHKRTWSISALFLIPSPLPNKFLHHLLIITTTFRALPISSFNTFTNPQNPLRVRAGRCLIGEMRRSTLICMSYPSTLSALMRRFEGGCVRHRTNARSHAHTCAYIHLSAGRLTNVFRHTRAHARMHARARALAHARSLTRPRAIAHTHTHTHYRTHTLVSRWIGGWSLMRCLRQTRSRRQERATK